MASVITLCTRQKSTIFMLNTEESACKRFQVFSPIKIPYGSSTFKTWYYEWIVDYSARHNHFCLSASSKQEKYCNNLFFKLTRSLIFQIIIKINLKFSKRIIITKWIKIRKLFLAFFIFRIRECFEAVIQKKRQYGNKLHL